MSLLAVKHRMQTVAGGGWVPEKVNSNDVLDGHVVLDLQCLDRIYLNGYVPKLQVGGQVVTFLTQHLGNPIPSPALFKQIGDRFREAVRTFAETNGIPVLHLNTPDRSRWNDRKVDHVREFIDNATQPGVVVIVVAQEVQKVFMGYQRPSETGAQFGFDKADRRVTVYYFYILDPTFGLGFIKICSYFPYPLKMWVNGHEWAKRQAAAQGLAFTELANGFATCPDPARLQAICDRLGPAKLQAFFNYWIARIPCPFTRADRLAGYWWQLSMRQIEVSRTLVLDAPRQARAFFEALVADNIGIGRPAVVSMLFARRVQRNTPGIFSTRVFTTGTEVRIDGFYNRRLCALVAGLLGTTYTSSQMTYDLRRLRLHGLIRRVPRSNTYLLTTEGMRVALFYTKVHDRLLSPLLAAHKPPAPLPLRRALRVIDHCVDSYIDHARIRPAA